MPRTISPLLAACILGSLAASAAGQGPPSYDFDFATIGAVGNAPWIGPDPFGLVNGRGRVDYEYRIARMEVTTTQWMEFVNAFSVQPALLKPGGPRFVWGAGTWWGAVSDTQYTGPGIRWMLDTRYKQPDLIPVSGISWRDAALFCNWLNNGKPGEWNAIQDGSYDASTFSDNPNGTFNDQRTHHPQAQFWIPTLDEWLKAAHYDPNRYGPGQEGWWDYSHTSNTAPIPGIPGVGQTTAGLELPNFGEYDITLGAYPDVRSPWGLLDTSGGTHEWTEEIWAEQARVIDGADLGMTFPEMDLVWWTGAERPYFPTNGLRVAAAVPSPSGILTLCFVLGLNMGRGRRTIAFSKSCDCPGLGTDTVSSALRAGGE